ncbi:NnrS family protein [Marichromatium gracile]|uniref:Uncharacterized protein involved in response to NO n=1 Tax=Marichromatium gracile TaxID=1048 RepID=A0A4R4ACD0_MARGR|nr:NnrS family protein [Marichromatium gracile]MBK1709354.1 short-chain dehydrogenase [Marichromatium gracile]TCW36256.1 uncharacterized protein involved in response to NO [Marichromatium gracile]
MPTPAVLGQGFRPFFLAATLAAIADIVLWLAMLHGYWPWPHHLSGVGWHAHEMLFGYFAAVMAGFLLTAARNWTGVATPTGTTLAALLALWLAGRVAPWLGGPPLLAAALDLAFLPALAVALRDALWHGPNRANRAFMALLAAMSLAGAMAHLGALGWLAGGETRGHRLMLDLVVILLVLISARVMPFFIERGLAGARPRTWPALERALPALGLALALTDLIAPLGVLAGALAIALGGALLVRLAGWHDRRLWRTPMLAVLYVGLLWLALGLVLDGLSALGALAPRGALHALTVGAIGVVTLGMMARVTLGHSGRPMRAGRTTRVAFALINLAALARGLGPVVLPEGYRLWLVVGGACWIGAFALFLWVYAPMLVRPRADGLIGCRAGAKDAPRQPSAGARAPLTPGTSA